MTRHRTLSSAVVSAAAAGSLLLLSACDAGDEAPEDQNAEQGAEQDAEGEAGGDFNEADVEYATGMIAHHEQAIEMSDILLAGEGIDSEVETLAEDIQAAQGPEIDQLNGWLEDWGHSPEGMDDHEDMDHGDDMDHEGMMSEEQLGELEEAEGAEAEELFLEQMIEHHEGAVSSAEQHLQEGQNPEALELSEQIIADQNEEIELMEGMLENY